jgi:hypothetical protein
MRSILCAALLALATTTAGAAEDQFSANYWMPYCRSYLQKQTVTFDRATLDRISLGGKCAGLVVGWAYIAGNPPFGGKCASILGPFTYEQEIVVRYIDQRPEWMHERFALALEAIYDLTLQVTLHAPPPVNVTRSGHTACPPAH